MARKRSHKNPLSDALKRAVAKSLIKITERDNWSAPEICHKIQAFYERHKDISVFGDPELQHDDFYPNAGTIRTILTEARIPSDGTAKVLHIWLSADHSEILHGITVEEGEPFVSYCRMAFGHAPGARPDKMADYAGIFKLYRPFHLDPFNKIAVEKLEIGNKESPFYCSLTCRYEIEGVIGGAYSVGKSVPHGPRLFMLMQVGSNRDSNIIIFFDRTDRDQRYTADDREPPVVGLAGCMIAAVGTFDVASAWPCYAQRLKDDEIFEPHVLAKSDLMTIPARARGALARGAIYWNHEEYPYPFGK